MGDKTDTKGLVRGLDQALRLQARDAVAAALAAGMASGPEGLALAGRLSDLAADELRDVERLASRAAVLGGKPAVQLDPVKPPKAWRALLGWLADGERETLDALVEAIPADADDTEGEATEHLLEHMIARKRDALELLERALG